MTNPNLRDKESQVFQGKEQKERDMNVGMMDTDVSMSPFSLFGYP